MTSAPLTDAELKELRLRLEEIKDNLIDQLNISKQSADVVSLDQTLVGRLSRMDAMQQQSMAVSTRDKASRRLQRVRVALAAFESGDYGYCRRCDEAIGSGRLRAQPEASLCIACQDRADQQ